MRAPLWLASVLALVAADDSTHVPLGQALNQPTQQHHRRLEGSTTATGRMSAHPPFRLFQALSTQYEITAAEAQKVEVSAFSSTVFSDAKANVVANKADGGGDDEDTGEEPSDGDNYDEDDDGYNFVAVRTRKPVPECTPRPKRVPRTPVAHADDEGEEDDGVEVSRDEEVVESSAANIAGEASNQSDSDSITAASAATVFYPLSSVNFTTSSATASEFNSSLNATSSEVPGSNSTDSAGDPPGPALNATSSSPAMLGSRRTENSSSGSAVGAINQTGGSINGGTGDGTSNLPVSAGLPANSTQPALVPPAKPGIVSNSSPCIPISVEGDATYCVSRKEPKSEGILSCSGAAPMQTSSSSVDLNRICPRKGDVAIGASCHPHLKSFNSTTKSCIAPEDSRCIVIRTGVWGCSFSFSPSADGQRPFISTGTDQIISGDQSSNASLHGSTNTTSSVAVQTMSTASSLSANQTSEAIKTTAGEEQQQQQNESTVPGSLLIVTGVLAIALAVLAVVKRKRAQRKAPDQDVVLQGPGGTYLSYPKTPEISKATESMHSFT